MPDSHPNRPARVPVPALLAAVLAVVLAAATACSQGDAEVGASTPRASAPSPGADVPTADVTGRYARYVALGDSYTAAPLVPRTDMSSGCLRSSADYPALVAAQLPGVRLVDVSCSGADTGSMVGVQQTGNQAHAPQFDALTDDTDLVTVGIGGNDFGIFATLIGTCVRLRDVDPYGSPCSDRLGAGPSDRLTRELRLVRGRVAAVVDGIRDRAPHARVVVVGYPQIIPDRGTCPERLPLATGDYPYARRINEELARAVQRGAERADDYVDTFAASAGHDICADDAWINGQATDPSRALAFHPFAEEQAAVAELVLQDL